MSAFSNELLHIKEPLLEFGMGQKMDYARDGLFLYGPVEGSAIAAMSYGIVGTRESVDRFELWANNLRTLVDVPTRGPRSKEVEPQHVAFPGFAEAFGIEWPAKPSCVIGDIDGDELQRSLHVANRYEAVRAAVNLFVDPLVRANNRLESPPDLWVVVVPEYVFQLGRPLSSVKKSEQVRGSITISKGRAQRLEVEPTLFGQDEKDAEVYRYTPNFRRQLKARLLEDKIVTQLVRETTIAPNDFLKANGYPLRRVEDAATIAWNFSTAAYYKAGGRPWQLADIRPGVCYVGLVYKRDDLASDPRYSCCAAQMFLTDGEGVVFRGALGPWFNAETRQFHLDFKAAHSLMSMVVNEYRTQFKNPPRELFIHAQSAFSRDEWDGFSAAVPRETSLVGVQIKETANTKLFRRGKYPVLRGTALPLDSTSALLWTTGYVPRLDTYMGPETPNPVFVRVQRGASPIETVLRDIMGLTKINFNACTHSDHLPVTIKFANAVGDVIAAAPQSAEPRLPFKFYI